MQCNNRFYRAIGTLASLKSYAQKMATISNKVFYELLGAPLKNYRWSWGAARPDNSVMLTCWNEKRRKINGKTYALILWSDKAIEAWPESNQKSPGMAERRHHAEMITQGAKTYIRLVKGEAGVIDDVNDRGDVSIDEDGAMLVALDGRMPIRKLKI
ncbi:hypothetical protein J7438_01760 [Thalassotalea sp. G20_0]|uniref:hypothetical protein n=1 Tax=Thalassotalea sp. G20_0 TaxID=2821093 RepID=UPI001ADD0EF6|nr:hypothetical protein [Thalassotalea sp. G20_0]MBO9492819.1 hypothetical protein [Thalassotalea sp. G20_0]